MSLFVCSNKECRTIENSATSQYWMTEDKDNVLCSECDPRLGKWHGRFPKTKYNWLFWKIDSRNYVGRRWFCWGILKWKVKILLNKLK